MPRSARLDIPHILHHVMARGIEGRDIFRDEKDREVFLQRLSELITKGKAQLFAWSLMSNHFHILLRPCEMSLSTIMRRLLTGYAVWSNKHYNRKGHFFQNRYKSIIVEEDPYFLELVRYIHLNPVRAGIVNRISDLDRYPYTGHSVILGYRVFTCQDVEWVLKRFGPRADMARFNYRDFVGEGFNQGLRKDLRGGGGLRKHGYRIDIGQGFKKESEARDERILGSESFVKEVLKSNILLKGETERIDIEVIINEICKNLEISRRQLFSRSRGRRISQARRLFLLRAYDEAGESMASLARLCGMSHTSVREAIEKARLELSQQISKP